MWISASIRVIPTVFISVLLAVLLPGISQADFVTTKASVTNPVTIQADHDPDSTALGVLQPGQTLPYDGSVPWWHRVRLADGTIAYLSKFKTRVVADPSVAGATTLRLGGWNTKKLGHGSSKDFALMAQVIEANFDILAVLEVMQKKGAPGAGYDTLMATLGSAWAGLITSEPRPNTTSGNSEFYAVIYRTSLAGPCAGWTALRYHTDNDGSHSGTGQDLFDREPAYGCFETPVGSTAPTFDFMLGVFHARWDGGSVPSIFAEAQNIDDVFTSMAGAVAGETDLILIGDFNLVPGILQQATAAADRTDGSGSTLNSTGARTTNLYDHVLVWDETATSEMAGNATVLDVRGVSTSNQKFYTNVSDHLPIRVLVRTEGPDDDP